MTTTSPDRFRSLRGALIGICGLSILWAAVVTFTNGFVIHVLGIAVSSREPRNPALLAVLSALAAWSLPIPDRRAALHAWQMRWSSRWTTVSSRWPRLIDPAAGFALLGIAIQFGAWRNARPLWLDEEMIALNVRDRSLPDLAGPLWLGQSAPYGWLALERLALVTFGTGELALRLVPVLFGVGTLVVAQWAGRRWLNPIGSGVFVLLCAVAQWLARYPSELKHYSADAFWGLLIPAAAVWAVETSAAESQRQRARLWWLLAAVGHWFSNGALLTTAPAGIVLLVMRWRRTGTQALVEFAAGACVWLVSFGLHFFTSVRHTLGNEYLRNYWSGGLPAESLGVTATISWLASLVQPLAANPGGAERGLMFWGLALIGFVLAPRPLGVILALIPVSAFALGGFALVPLIDRAALWIVPALYFGIAIVADRSVRFARIAYLRRSTRYLVISAALGAATVSVSGNIVSRGWAAVESRRASTSNRGSDDRAAVRWLLERRHNGEAVITTQLGLPAVWWYGSIDIASGPSPGSRLGDGAPMLQATYVAGEGCHQGARAEAMAGQTRVVVYIGFPDAPPGFPRLLITTLGRLGRIEADRTFADESRAAIIELIPSRVSAAGGAADGALIDQQRGLLRGCIALKAASRW